MLHVELINVPSRARDENDGDGGEGKAAQVDVERKKNQVN